MSGRHITIPPRTKFPVAGPENQIHLEEEQNVRIELSQSNLQDIRELEEPGKPVERKRFEIPTPIIREVRGYENDVRPGPPRPRHFIRHESLPEDPHDLNRLDYLADADDIKFLTQHSTWGPHGERPGVLTIPVFEQLMDVADKIAPASDLKRTVMEIVGDRLALVGEERMVADVAKYYTAKRSRWRKALLRRLWPKTPAGDQDPQHVFRPREEESSRPRRSRRGGLDGLTRLQDLRVEFEHVLKGLDLVVERERLKKVSIQYQEEIFRQALQGQRGGPWLQSLPLHVERSLSAPVRKPYEPHAMIPGTLGAGHAAGGGLGGGHAHHHSGKAGGGKARRASGKKKQGSKRQDPAQNQDGQWVHSDVDEEEEEIDPEADADPRVHGPISDLLTHGNDQKLRQLLLHHPGQREGDVTGQAPAFASGPGVNCAVGDSARRVGPDDAVRRLLLRSFLRPVRAPAAYAERPGFGPPSLAAVEVLPATVVAAAEAADGADGAESSDDGVVWEEEEEEEAEAEAEAKTAYFDRASVTWVRDSIPEAEAVGNAQPRYRCRGRIGRGGRLIIDRDPVPVRPRTRRRRVPTPAVLRALVLDTSRTQADAGALRTGYAPCPLSWRPRSQPRAWLHYADSESESEEATAAPQKRPRPAAAVAGGAGGQESGEGAGGGAGADSAGSGSTGSAQAAAGTAWLAGAAGAPSVALSAASTGAGGSGGAALATVGGGGSRPRGRDAWVLDSKRRGRREVYALPRPAALPTRVSGAVYERGYGVRDCSPLLYPASTPVGVTARGSAALAFDPHATPTRPVEAAFGGGKGGKGKGGKGKGGKGASSTRLPVAAPLSHPMGQISSRPGAILSLLASEPLVDLRTRIDWRKLNHYMSQEDSEEEEVVLAGRGHFLLTKDMETVGKARSSRAAAMGISGGLRTEPMKFSMRL